LNINQFCEQVCDALVVPAAKERMQAILANDPARLAPAFKKIRHALELLPASEHAGIEALVQLCLCDVLSAVFGALDGNPFIGTETPEHRLRGDEGQPLEESAQEAFLAAAESRGL
jgi:hypothetical protein